MKKETIIAIFFGGLLGLTVAFFMISKSKEASLQKTKVVTNEAKVTPTIILLDNQLQNLEISQPEDGLIVNKKNITITGKATKDFLIVIQSPIKDIVFKNTKGSFNVDFPLALGENNIKILAFSDNTQLPFQEKDLKIYYLDEQ
ncbi:MAG: hypothetical protein QHH09_02885 [Microgenomates group bacterium]|nr:hypothetical protein [Microgenomates group bacterium]